MRTHLSGSHCLYSAFQTGERRCQSLFLGTARDPRPPPPGSPSRAGAPETGAQPSEGCRRTWASRRGLRGAGVFAEWERGHSHGRSSASFQAPPHTRDSALVPLEPRGPGVGWAGRWEHLAGRGGARSGLRGGCGLCCSPARPWERAPAAGVPRCLPRGWGSVEAEEAQGRGCWGPSPSGRARRALRRWEPGVASRLNGPGRGGDSPRREGSALRRSRQRPSHAARPRGGGGGGGGLPPGPWARGAAQDTPPSPLGWEEQRAGPA